MEKSKMMHGYEQETGKMSMSKELYEKLVSIVEEGLKPLDQLAIRVNQRIELLEMQLEEAQAKATAYDRLMSGGKKTLKEFANLLGRVVVVNANGDIESFAGEPRIDLHYGFWYLDEDDEDYEDFRYFIPNDIVDYTGDWKDSLTLPDGWED